VARILLRYALFCCDTRSGRAARAHSFTFALIRNFCRETQFCLQIFLVSPKIGWECDESATVREGACAARLSYKVWYIKSVDGRIFNGRIFNCLFKICHKEIRLVCICRWAWRSYECVSFKCILGFFVLVECRSFCKCLSPFCHMQYGISCWWTVTLPSSFLSLLVSLCVLVFNHFVSNLCGAVSGRVGVRGAYRRV